MRHAWRWIALGLLLVGLPLAAAGPPPRELGQAGRVEGFVRDAETGEYLADVAVKLLQPPDCAPIKGSSFQTRPGGYYTINAPLGRLKSSFNWGDIGNLSILGLLTGGSKKITSYIEVSQVCLTVSKPGYHTFAGPVPVRYASSQSFSVELPVIELAPEGVGYRSYAGPDCPSGDLEVLPAKTLLQPGEPCEVRVLARHVPLQPGQLPQIVATVFSPNAADLNWSPRTREEPFEAVGLLGLKVGPKRPGVHRAFFMLKPPSNGAGYSGTVHYFAVGVPAGRDAEAQAAVDELNALASSSESEPKDFASPLAKLDSIFAGNPDYQTQISALEALATAMKAHDWETARKLWGPLHNTAWDGELALADLIDSALNIERNPEDAYQRKRYQARFESARRQIEKQPVSVRAPFRSPALLAALESPGFPELEPKPEPEVAMNPLQAAVEALNAGDLPAAEAAFAKLDPKSRQSLSGQAVAGRIALQSGDEPTARKLFADALKPENAKAVADYEAWLSYTRMLLANGDWDTAYPLLQLLLVYGRNASSSTAAPFVGGYYPGMGMVGLLTGPARAGTTGFDRSEAALAQILVTVYPYLANPAGDPLSAAIGARSLAELGLLDRALDLSAAAAEAAPDNEHVTAVRATVLLFGGDREEARAVVARLRALNPKHPDLAKLESAVQVG